MKSELPEPAPGHEIRPARHPYTSRQASYDLRRLRREEFLKRLPGRNVCQLTDTGRALATFLTKLVARAVLSTLTELQTPPTASTGHQSSVVTAWRRYEHELDTLIATNGLAE